ncbi:hypothetical protein [Bradyrhizobium sp. JR3.5]
MPIDILKHLAQQDWLSSDSIAYPLDGIGIAELPEFIVAEHLADGRMEAILMVGRSQDTLLKSVMMPPSSAGDRAGFQA